MHDFTHAIKLLKHEILLIKNRSNYSGIVIYFQNRTSDRMSRSATLHGSQAYLMNCFQNRSFVIDFLFSAFYFGFGHLDARLGRFVPIG